MFADKKFSLLLFILGLAFVLEAPRYGFGTLATPEPGLVPFLMALCFLGLEAADLGYSLARRRRAAPGPAAREPAPAAGPGFRDSRIHFVILTAVGIFLTYIVGLPAAIGIYGALCAWLLGLRSWWKNLIFGACLGLVIHYLFEVFFETELPSGWLWSLMGG